VPPADKKKKPGRRANYAPKPDQVGTRKYLPLGWSNWVGFALFGLLGIAVLAELISAISEGGTNDPIVAAIVLCLFGWMTYLFATNRLKD
jgi:putative Mn2+ efflux pump MntP